MNTLMTSILDLISHNATHDATDNANEDNGEVKSGSSYYGGNQASNDILVC